MPTATAADSAKPSTSVRNMEYLHAACDVVRNVLYSTKENVQLLHEVFRQVRQLNGIIVYFENQI